MGKKSTKRSKQKYPYLKKRVNSRVRQEVIDYDYIDKLSDEEKQWLNDFSSEYYGADVGKQADEGKNNRFIKGRDKVKEIQDENNARNRDLFGRVRNKVGATKLLNYDDVINIVEESLSRDINPENLEDALNEFLDKKFVDSGSNSNDSGKKSE